MLNKRGEDGSERGRGMKREEMWEKGGGRENERIWITWVHEVSAFKSFLCFSQFSVLFLFPFPSFQRPFFRSFCSWPPRFSSFFIRAQMTPSSPNVLYYYKYVSIIHIFFYLDLCCIVSDYLSSVYKVLSAEWGRSNSNLVFLTAAPSPKLLFF